MASEEWKAIDGWPYEVSSLGNVRKLGSGMSIRPFRQASGYLNVGLHCHGRTKKVGLHRLVAAAFVPNPDGKPEVNHKDGDKENNAASNLEWCTRAENMRHAVMTGLSRVNAQRVADLARRNARRAMKPVLRSDGAVFDSVKAAAEASGAAPTNVSRCCVGKGHSTAGYGFSFIGSKEAPDE